MSKKNKTVSKAKLPYKYNDQGNQKLREGKYDQAIEFYNRAISENNKEAQFYCNRSDANHKIGNFLEALQDAEKSISINNQFITGYLRKIQALEQLNELKDLINFLQSSLVAIKDKSGQDFIQELLQKYQKQLDVKLKEIEDNKEDFQKFSAILNSIEKSQQTNAKKIDLIYSKDSGRGLQVTQNIKKGDEIIFISQDQMMSIDLALNECQLLKKIVQKNENWESEIGKHIILPLYLIQEKQKKDSQWKNFIDIIPEKYETNPLYFDENDMNLLQNSPFINYIHERQEDLKNEYNLIKNYMDQEMSFSLEEFTWATVTCNSRQFGIKIQDKKNNSLVQIADLINHSVDPNAEWKYNEKKNGLQVIALQNISKGTQITYNYGIKSNARLLLNYGFTEKTNQENEVVIPFQFNPNDKLLNKKLKFIGSENNVKIMKLQQGIENIETSKTIGYLRYILIEDESVLDRLQQLHQNRMEKENLKEPFNPINTPPIDLKSEQIMWATLNQICFQQQKQYSRSFENDYEQLSNKDLSFNERNCLNLVMGEKMILFSMIQISQQMITLMDKDKKEFLQALKDPQYNKYSSYLLRIIMTIVKQ